MLSVLADVWTWLLSAISLAASIVATVHVVLRKRDERSVIGWVGLIWLAPILGVLAYIGFGINRIRRRGLRLAPERGAYRERVEPGARRVEEDLQDVAQRYPSQARLARLIARLTSRDLTAGNKVRPLRNGDAAYPEMLAAIAEARQSVTMSTYILDNDRAGREFIDALAQAHRRGVRVRVLIDAVGAHYSRPTAVWALRAAGVPCEVFLPTMTPRLFRYANLRNHRKILVVDGAIGFTGGMNVRQACRLDWSPAHPTQDLHFRLDGPIVSQLQEVFAVDWAFSTREVLEGAPWFPELTGRGDVMARVISDGPDEDFDKLRLTLLGALSVARRQISIVTPYFLPDVSIRAALDVAALRGVDVRIVLPEHSNIPVVDWATRSLLWQIIEYGCRVWLTPAPFDHAKLLVVDDAWTLLGSTNWDARSLRLNFELNVECYDGDLAAQLTGLVDEKIAAARAVRFEELDARALPVKFRDGAARVLSPYL